MEERTGTSLLISDVVSLANEAFFVSLSHMREKFITVEETLAAKLTQRMHAALDLIRRGFSSMIHRRKVSGKLWVGI